MFRITSVVVTLRPFRPENKASAWPRVISKNAAAVGKSVQVVKP